jgi:hypothetical protein
VDFIHLGMTLLQATRLRPVLDASQRQSRHQVFSAQDLPPDYVYPHPSIFKLAKALKGSSNTLTSQIDADDDDDYETSCH